jgi:hypothetical protein
MLSETDVESECKNCYHDIRLHNPDCKAKSDNNIHDDDICHCDIPQYYNTIVSGKYIGWTEVHCNTCGKLVCLIDSTNEDVYNFLILCPQCIAKIK